MRCPGCGKSDNRVIDSREQGIGKTIKINHPSHKRFDQCRCRRRECNLCSHHWGTFEVDANDFENLLRQNLKFKDHALIKKIISLLEELL